MKTSSFFYFIFRGLLACAGFFLVFGMTQTPDGVFVRPHPGKLIDFFKNDIIIDLHLFSSLASGTLFQCTL
jgi:hypothetical protein